MLGCCLLTCGHSPEVIYVVETCATFPLEYAANEEDDILAAGSSPSQAEWQAYVHEVVPLNLETHQGPITGIEGKLPVCSEYVTLEQKTAHACFIDEGDVIGDWQLHLIAGSQVPYFHT